MPLLSDVWPSIAAYIADNVSVMPVYDQGERIKRPCGDWKKYQSIPATEAELFAAMERYNTTGIAIIAGEVSGNLEIIDIDTKHWPGIDATYFTSLQTIFPELYAKLRKHRTPSGGWHILYRIADHAPEKNLKLAWAPDAKEAGIETRGEGGYVVAPPSFGYELVGNTPIPAITWEERCSLINLARALNTRVTVKKERKPRKHVEEYYDENPFQHFNGSQEAEEVLGWEICEENANYLYFTRPGKKSGVSASFNKTDRFYYIFTSSTDFEPSKGYSPAAVLAQLHFNNDWQKVYAHLVSKGYGRAKPAKERERAVRLARAGHQAPPNFSEEAKTIYTATVNAMQQAHPFGTFWNYDPDDDKHTISRESLQRIAGELGFCLYRNNLSRITGITITTQSSRDFIDGCKSYIKEEDSDQYESICNAFESFMQRSGSYTETRLPIITPERVLRDTAKTCYKCYRNGYLTITGAGMDFAGYEDFTLLIPEARLLQRDFTIDQEVSGKFADFLLKATGGGEVVSKVLGYLSHDYRDETQGYIVVLSEQCPDPQMGGGSGKSLLCNLLTNTTSVCLKNAAQVQYDEKFFGSWNFERLFVCGDAPKGFRFDFLKEPSTGRFTFKRLFKDPVEVPGEDGPKFIVNTNYSFVNLDGGMERRIIPIEFTDFFNRNNSVIDHYGCHFPSGWSNDDWSNFDNTIAACIQLWLASPRLTNPGISVGGFEKQMRQKHGETTYEFVTANIDRWIAAKVVQSATIRESLREFCNDGGVAPVYQPSIKRVIMCIADICRERRQYYAANVVRRVGITVSRCHVFDAGGYGDDGSGDTTEEPGF